jgi:predicted SnoaL-like aldol condensation-catalyzing enzyme
MKTRGSDIPEPLQSALREEAERNREIVLAFFRQGLMELQPRKAFERYVSEDFIEHKPDVPLGTREATIAYLEDLISSLPSAHWEPIRTIADGEFVLMHVRFTPAPGAEPYAIADIFRIRNSLIVEHWDVVGLPPTQRRNPNPRF